MATAATLTRLEKAAVDNGFDQELPMNGNWLSFASTQAPLRIWLCEAGQGEFIAALSHLKVGRVLAEQGTTISVSLPEGAAAACSVAGFSALDRLVRRAFQLSKTLPDELLHAFKNETEALPRATEAERLVVMRVGQALFRDGLIDYWEGRCAITGLSVTPLLRASHIKPWSDCSADAERLDVFNGLLLAPHLDAAFDSGFITVADDGLIIVSPAIAEGERRILGIEQPLSIRTLAEGHRHYLPWHRERVFKPSRTR